MREHGRRIAWIPTLARKGREPLHRTHLRFAQDGPKPGVLHCFLLDCSASMLRGASLARAKGLLLGYFERLARERAEAALIRFGGAHAHVLFGPAVPRWWSERWIHPIAGGGGTPLALGMAAAARLLELARRRRSSQERVLWVLTDGRTRERAPVPPAADRVVVVDCGQGRLAEQGCRRLAHDWGADYLRLDEIAIQWISRN